MYADRHQKEWGKSGERESGGENDYHKERNGPVAAQSFPLFLLSILSKNGTFGEFFSAMSGVMSDKTFVLLRPSAFASHQL